MKTILEELMDLKPEEVHPVNNWCELTGHESHNNLDVPCTYIIFTHKQQLSDLFPSIKEQIMSGTVPKDYYARWTFSNQVLNLTQEQLKAHLALGLLKIY
jgi:hypothetical protein